jgi:hypothetical protein
MVDHVSLFLRGEFFEIKYVCFYEVYLREVLDIFHFSA